MSYTVDICLFQVCLTLTAQTNGKQELFGEEFEAVETLGSTSDDLSERRERLTQIE